MYKKRSLHGDAWAYLQSLECCAKAQKTSLLLAWRNRDVS